MKPIEVKLAPEDDRVVPIRIEDAKGNTYVIHVECIAHHFDEDELQISVFKPSKDNKCWHRPNGIIVCGRIERPEVIAHYSEHRILEGHSAWFEFHELPAHNLPRKLND